MVLPFLVRFGLILSTFGFEHARERGNPAFFKCAKELQRIRQVSAIFAYFFELSFLSEKFTYSTNLYGLSRMSSTGSVSRKRSRSRSKDASRSPAKSRHRSDRSKKRRRENLQANNEVSNSNPDIEKTFKTETPILEKLLNKMSSISSAVDSLNERMSCLESTRAKGTDNTAAQQGSTSCPKRTDVSDQLSIAVPLDAGIEDCSPVILDSDFSHGVGNRTSKSLTQSHLSSLQIFTILEDFAYRFGCFYHTPKLDKAIADQIAKNYKKSVETL